MSSILLINPFAPSSPPPPSQTGPDNANAQSDDAVTPAQGTKDTGASGNATSYSGGGSNGGQNSGSGGQNQPASATLTQLDRKPDQRPSNATGTSVVNAQTSETAEQKARALAITAQQKARATALIDSITVPQDLPELAEKANRDMPDPLPTSPFLKRVSE